MAFRPLERLDIKIRVNYLGRVAIQAKDDGVASKCVSNSPPYPEFVAVDERWWLSTRMRWVKHVRDDVFNH